MSTKSTLFLTNDFNEECFKETEPFLKGQADFITIEFDKQNIRIERNNERDLILTITNPNAEIYKIFEQIGKLATKEQK